MRGSRRTKSRFDAAVVRRCGGGGQAGERQRGELFGNLLHAKAALRVVPFVKPVQHAEQPIRGDLNIEILAKLAVVDALSDDPLPASLILFRRKADHFAKAALYRFPLAQIDKEMRIMAIEGFQMRQNRPPKLLSRCALGGGNVGNRPIHLRYRLLDDEIEQFLLAVEMVVEAALQDADRVGDVAHRGRVIAFGPEHLRGGRNYVVECGHLWSSPSSAGVESASSRWLAFPSDASLLRAIPRCSTQAAS